MGIFKDLPLIIYIKGKSLFFYSIFTKKLISLPSILIIINRTIVVNIDFFGIIFGLSLSGLITAFVQVSLLLIQKLGHQGRRPSVSDCELLDDTLDAFIDLHHLLVVALALFIIPGLHAFGQSLVHLVQPPRVLVFKIIIVLAQKSNVCLVLC